MKLCPTCGRTVPDRYETSHHPNGCTCPCFTLHAPDGNNQGPQGCIWNQTVDKTKEDPYQAYLRLIRDRDEADHNPGSDQLANQKEH